MQLVTVELLGVPTLVPFLTPSPLSLPSPARSTVPRGLALPLPPPVIFGHIDICHSMRAVDHLDTPKGHTLTLRGERKLDSEVKKESYHRIERAYGSYSSDL